MRILGIETSCDETAAAIVEDGTKILSSIVASSQKIHVKTGGIIPETAAREQIKYLIPVINKALTQVFGKPPSLRPKPSPLSPKPYTLNPGIDALAVTVGPGLIGSLLIGVETAKTLAYLWQKPIVPVNHLTAHLYANWLNPKPYTLNPTPFPAIALIASGGHTDLLLMRGHGKLKWLGGTRDDAAGEAFDKIARLLGLPYPGGPSIAKEAEKFAIGKLDDLKIKLPRPLMNEDVFDFSFSGLKTAVLREVNQLKTMKQFNNEAVGKLAFEAQEAIIDVLVGKTIRAAQKYKVKSIILGGGVTANQRLREKFKLSLRPTPYTLHVPPVDLSTDNAAIIASCAFFNYHPVSWKTITANPSLHFE